ncbi:MAG: cobalt ECF transporter T component CbiQ [Methanosarcinaceae archaeon]|nr:cobalt ECF transporter T component CbiQ [Methanosarcinaceae archaeon]MDD4331778.1 cobalt ECF transporter T component CbiQ [Methanosarcinaceae archaeon]MDD4748888.1 cobalt ECF transporter T component CbiQ [Methanosarcinaceae archaeon]
MITLSDIEHEAYKKSPIHRLDARVKLLFALAIIIYAVSLPRIHENNGARLLLLESYLLCLGLLASLDFRYFILRFLAVLPFGFAIACIQPFLKPSFIESFTPYPLSLPFGLSLSYEGLAFGLSLLLKFTVCVTTIILLSSTTRLRDMVIAANRLGIPGEFTLLLSMMVRYLFLFWGMLRRIRVAQETRLFDIWNKKVPRKWILTQVGNSISSIFIRAYEQGEKSYISMLCRGYGNGHEKYYYSSKIGRKDALFLLAGLGYILLVHFLPKASLIFI